MNRSRRSFMVTASVCVLVLLVALAGRFVLLSEERRIETTLGQAIEDIRNERLDACMSHISSSHWDSTQVTREELRAVVQEGFDTFENIRVIYDDFEAKVSGNEASVRVKAKVFARYDDQVVLLLGTLTEGRRLELGLVKEGRRWLFTSVSGVEIHADPLEESRVPRMTPHPSCPGGQASSSSRNSSRLADSSDLLKSKERIRFSV